MEEKTDFSELSKQLRCPSGEHAKEVGDNMFQSNGNMIFTTINSLALENQSIILEIGFGNGKHLPRLFSTAENLSYTGIDISSAMVDEAIANNQPLVTTGKAQFEQVDGSGTLHFPDSNFSHCFTANTLYFWEHPQQHFDAIFRVLQPDGIFALAFVEKKFGEQLPFTKSEFTFYEKEQVEVFMQNAGFRETHCHTYSEETQSKDGQKVNRPFLILVGRK